MSLVSLQMLINPCLTVLRPMAVVCEPEQFTTSGKSMDWRAILRQQGTV
jgi:hypothetical protein